MGARSERNQTFQIRFLAVSVRFDIVTIFPRMIEAALSEGILARAIQRELLAVRARDLREFTDDRHRTVDDVPYGGGPGMVIKPEPVFKAVDAIRREAGEPQAVVLVSPHGRRFTQAELAARNADRVVILCGDTRVDDRVGESRNRRAFDRDLCSAVASCRAGYRRRGGEADSGRLGDDDSWRVIRFRAGSWTIRTTRAAEFREWKVPDVLVSGHHGEIRSGESGRRLS